MRKQAHVRTVRKQAHVRIVHNRCRTALRRGTAPNTAPARARRKSRTMQPRRPRWAHHRTSPLNRELVYTNFYNSGTNRGELPSDLMPRTAAH